MNLLWQDAYLFIVETFMEDNLTTGKNRLINNVMIKKLFSKDEKNIHNAFGDNELSIYVKQFIFNNAFTCLDFYSPLPINDQLADELLDQFYQFLRTENISESSINIPDPKSLKDNLVHCLNLHNDFINKHLLDDDFVFLMKYNKSNYNKIIQTLQTGTAKQKSDKNIDYLSKQLESIIFSIRSDIFYLRKTQKILIWGFMLFTIISAFTIPGSFKYNLNENALMMMLVFLIAIIFFLLTMFISVSKKIILQENRLNSFVAQLWELHFNTYEKYIEKYSLERPYK